MAIEVVDSNAPMVGDGGRFVVLTIQYKTIKYNKNMNTKTNIIIVALTL